MNPIVLIPARMAATRLPGKPLAEIAGTPMIVHVWRRAVEAAVGRVAVAAADPEVAEAVRDAGGEAVMTRPEHASGSDRVYEALHALDAGGDHDVVVNLQGDLPDIDPSVIRAALVPLTNPQVDVATVAFPTTDADEGADPNVVKAVVALGPGGRLGRALYFSRLPVPGGEGPLYHHVGLYAFRREALARFVKLPPGALERRERLEQLRALEAGMRIDVALVDRVPLGVDTPADLARVRARMSGR